MWYTDFSLKQKRRRHVQDIKLKNEWKKIIPETICYSVDLFINFIFI